MSISRSLRNLRELFAVDVGYADKAALHRRCAIFASPAKTLVQEGRKAEVRCGREPSRPHWAKPMFKTTYGMGSFMIKSRCDKVRLQGNPERLATRYFMPYIVPDYS